MLFRLDPHSPIGLADQIAAQVRAAVVTGELVADDRLPAAREVAAGLEVNMHTVLRAYATLRDEGLVELRRGRGAQIASTGAVDSLGERVELSTMIRDLVTHAQRLGLTRTQLIKEISTSWS